MLLPCGDSADHGFPIRDPAVKALEGQDIDLDFRQMPISAFGRLNEAASQQLRGGTVVPLSVGLFPALQVAIDPFP